VKRLASLLGIFPPFYRLGLLLGVLALVGSEPLAANAQDILSDNLCSNNRGSQNRRAAAGFANRR
jgi:hypothetical protein